MENASTRQRPFEHGDPILPALHSPLGNAGIILSILIPSCNGAAPFQFKHADILQQMEVTLRRLDSALLAHIPGPPPKDQAVAHPPSLKAIVSRQRRRGVRGGRRGFTRSRPW